MSEDTRLILHVKGTEDQTTELPKKVVRAAIAQGQLSRSQLIWSEVHNAWKQVRELPHLLPSQKLAPAPTPRPRVGTGPLPKFATGTIPKVATGALPKVATGALPDVAGSSQRPVAETVSADPSEAPRDQAPAKGKSASFHVAEKDDGAHPLKWLCAILGTVILIALAVNFFLVDQPLTSAMTQTPYAKVTVYAHLGGFMQPGDVVIHIVPSSGVTSSNLIPFLMSVAQSTPNAPISNDAFERVSLTTEWTGQYSISGAAWKDFGKMDPSDVAKAKQFLEEQMGNASGQPWTNSHASDDVQQAEREKAWEAFVRNFTAS